MQRLFSYFFILSSLCSFHLHLRLAGADNALPPGTNDCNSETNQSVSCGNLSISYPFGDDAASCVLSGSFRINCSSSPPKWDVFTEALPSDEDNELGAPVLTGIYGPPFLKFVNLTWNQTFMKTGDVCGSLPIEAIDTYIPRDIDLTSFANGSFLISSYNYILLLNCSNLASNMTPAPDGVQINTSTCLYYQANCTGGANVGPCAQIEVPTRQLRLREDLETFSCSHFQLLVTANDKTSVASWTRGLVQVFYGDAQCEACYRSNGTCHFDSATNRIFQMCYCPGNTYSDTDCFHIHKCKGMCRTRSKILVAVAGSIGAMLIVMVLTFWVYHRKYRYSSKSFTSSSSNRLFTQRAYMLSKRFGPVATKEFSFESLSRATKGFDDANMIGDGGFGAVYLGVLKDGRKVAVKRLYHDNFRRMDHFYNEIKILSTLSHPNLVELYGFCCQDSTDLLLVFEFASNGTVSDQLHDATKPAMPWRTRLRIARETAQALSYLHNSVKPPIFHRDVKTTNILLDDNLRAKLADFGLSRLVPLEATHVSTAPQGTPGYLDPDYHQCYQLTDKSDVYSFGVVLVELVSAKLAVDMNRDRREINLWSLALMKIGSGQWEDLVDPRLDMEDPVVENTVKRVIELAFMCLHAEKDSRPTMKYIADMLTSMCKESGCGYYDDDDDDANGTAASVVDPNSPSSMDEATLLMKSRQASKPRLSAVDESPLSSADWTSSNGSSHVASF